MRGGGGDRGVAGHGWSAGPSGYHSRLASLDRLSAPSPGPAGGCGEERRARDLSRGYMPSFTGRKGRQRESL